MPDKQTIIPAVTNEYPWGLATFQTNLAQLRAKIDAGTATREEVDKYNHIQNSFTLIKESPASHTGSAVYAKGILYKVSDSSESRFGGVYKLYTDVLYIRPNDVDDQITTTGVSTPCTMTARIREEYDKTYNPQNGDLCIIELPKTPLEQSRPNVYITYVYNLTETSGGWRQVDVPAEHIWFLDGIRRNAAWGVQPESETLIEHECRGMNLIQLLEYFLIGNIPGVYPDLTGVWGNMTWTPLTVSFTPSIVHSLDTMETLIPAGVPLTFGEIKAPTKYTVGGQTTTLGPAKVSGMTYGYWDGSAKQDATSISGDPVSVTTRYTNKSTNEAKLEVQAIAGFDVADIPSPATLTSTPTSNNVVIPSFNMTPVEGINTIAVKFTNTYGIDTIAISGTIEHLPDYDYFNSKNKHEKKLSAGLTSNQDVVTSDKVVNRPSQSISDVKTKTVSKTFNAVYPIYANGCGLPAAAEHETGPWSEGDRYVYAKWPIYTADASEIENNRELCPKLINYIDPSSDINSIQIGFGDSTQIEYEDEYYDVNIHRTIYTPPAVNSVEFYKWNTMSNSWAIDNTWSQDGTINITGKLYKKWVSTLRNAETVTKIICS